jgi:hypothetical protein
MSQIEGLDSSANGLLRARTIVQPRPRRKKKLTLQSTDPAQKQGQEGWQGHPPCRGCLVGSEAGARMSPLACATQ